MSLSVTLPLKKMTRDAIRLNNIVFSRAPGVVFEAAGETFTLHFTPFGRKTAPGAAITARIDGARVRIETDRVFLERVMDGVLAGEDIAALPAELRETVLEAALETVLDRFEVWSGSEASIEKVAFGDEAAPVPGASDAPGDEGVALHFTLAAESGRRMTGTIRAERDAADHLAELLGRTPFPAGHRRLVGRAAGGGGRGGGPRPPGDEGVARSGKGRHPLFGRKRLGRLRERRRAFRPRAELPRRPERANGNIEGSLREKPWQTMNSGTKRSGTVSTMTGTIGAMEEDENRYR